jgi:hypothetical protein
MLPAEPVLRMSKSVVSMSCVETKTKVSSSSAEASL